jgi:hypothetical protein
MITKVIPRAISPPIEICRITLKIFKGCKNLGCRSENTRIKRIRKMRGENNPA